MSGLSWNISLPCEVAFGRRYLATVKPGVFPDLLGFQDVSTLTASSRNSYAESVIARAVAQAGATGLQHFTKGFETTGPKLKLQAHAALAWQARKDGQALFHFTWL